MAEIMFCDLCGEKMTLTGTIYDYEAHCLSCGITKRDRCEKCGNWLRLCGHDLPFAEKIKTIRIDKGGLK
jgi:hypothetical protein